jgi:hypothetical protein
VSRRTKLRLATMVLVTFGPALSAQGPTTAAIGGRVTDGAGREMAFAEVVVTNRATGASVRGRSRADGRFDVSGLDIGGPYSITVRRVGLQMREQHGIFLRLGERREVDVRMEATAQLLAVVETRAVRDESRSRRRMGTETSITDATIGATPMLNRDLYDLVRLVPQMSSRQAMVAPGTNGQLNSIRVDGVSEQGLSGNLPAGSAYGGKSIPLDAVKEYQVLLAPFDVRQGNFAGATINAATRSGTNALTATAFVYGTNEKLGPGVPFIRDARYQKEQFGFSAGGPLVRDRLLFFLATEFQRRSIPAIGPYVGQSPSADTPVPVEMREVERFQRLLSDWGLAGGSSGAEDNSNPASNVFLRLDAPLSGWNSRLVLRGNFSRADSQVFARPSANPVSNCPTSACFPLSSVRSVRSARKQSIAAQLYTNFANGSSNELLVSRLLFPISIGPTVQQPLVLVTVPGTSGQAAYLQSGTPELSSDSTSALTTELTDNLTIPIGSHRLTIGATTQRNTLRRFDLRGIYGIWEFASLDSLAAGTASRYRLGRDFGASRLDLRGYQSAVYAGDEWDVSPQLSLSFGVRADVPSFDDRPPYVAMVDTVLGRRTDQLPSRRIQWSPRLGFSIGALTGAAGSTLVRGGVGAFTARPPMAWLLAPFANPGLSVRTLQCGTLTADTGPAPNFVADPVAAPLACANGQGFASRAPAEVDAFDAEVRYPQVMRAAFALERQLASDLVGSIEVLYTHGLYSMFFAPFNLAPSTAVDRHGRVLFGAIGPTGAAVPKRISSRVSDAILVGNASGDRAFDATAELRKTFADVGEVQLSLTYARDRDVQSERSLRPVLLDNWRYARPVAGSQEDLSVGVSDFDVPVRVRMSGTVRAPWRRWRTDLSLYYIGGSGLPFTYVAGGGPTRGDLNADGGVGNDALYLPRSAFDTTEIQFAGSPAEVASQQRAFEEFVDGAACLRRQRGRIMARNSCRAPWSNLVNLSVRQSLPTVDGHVLALEVQVFNALNLLNARWGRVAIPSLATPALTSQVALLSQVGQTVGPPSVSQPLYRFDTTLPRYSVQNLESFYQIQLAMRYTVDRL